MGRFVTLFAALCFCANAFGLVTIHVSTKGSDAGGDGSVAKPLATLKAAVNLAGSLKKARPFETFEIVFEEGDYLFADDGDTVTIGKSLSGKDGEPFRIVGKGAVNFVGGVRIPAGEMREVSDKDILSRLPSERAGKLFYIDLKKFGVKECGKITSRGFSAQNGVPQMEAFYSAFKLTLARYPNGSSMKWNKTVHGGDKTLVNDKPNKRAEAGAILEYADGRHERWAKADDVWLSGIFNHGWAYNTVRVKKIDVEKKQIELEPLPYGVKTHSFLDINEYFAFNLLEEIDTVGEYYIDRKNLVFYAMFSKAPDKKNHFDFSVIEKPFIRFENGKNFEVRGINFEASRETALVFWDCKNSVVDRCNFRNIGKRAVEMTGSRFVKSKVPNPPLLSENNTISNCRAENTGYGGFVLYAGERVNLKSGNSRIVNCYSSDNSRLGKSYCPGINIGGVGVSVRHCHITNQAHAGIIWSGNDHVIESNIFERCCDEFDDMGAIYTGRNQSCCGNVVRYNFFAEMMPKSKEAKMCGVYIDDGSGHYLIEKNIFCRVGNPGKHNGFAAVFFHGGDGNEVKENIFVDCVTAVSCSVWSDKDWKKRIEDNMFKLKEEVDIADEAYLKKYPFLKNITEASRRRQNFVRGNLLFASNMVLKGDFVFEGNKFITPDDGVQNIPKGAWNLKKFEKYFGENPLSKEILARKPGLLK